MLCIVLLPGSKIHGKAVSSLYEALRSESLRGGVELPMHRI